VSSREGNLSVVGTEVGSHPGLGRLGEEIHHVLDQHLTDCSNHFVQIVKILDEDDRLAGCQVQEDLVYQRLVACDAVKRK
jgi:hypothetical protein